MSLWQTRGFFPGVCCVSSRHNLEKLQASQALSRSNTIRKVRAFLGMAVLFRWYVKDFIEVTAPLTKLIKKEEHFIWTPECEKTFYLLRQKLMTTPVLALPAFSKPFFMQVSARLMLSSGNDDKPIAYYYSVDDFCRLIIHCTTWRTLRVAH